MSRIACVWADFRDDAAANDWYENRHIPDVVGRLDTQARNAEPVEDNTFKEVEQIEGAFMTVYDLPDGKDAKEVDAQIQPALDELLTKDARLDARIYAEHANWFGSEWRGDVEDVQMWIVVLWQPAEAVHDEFVKWFTEEFAPGLLECPELLRTRVFKLENASLVQDQKREQQTLSSMYQYMTFWEFDCDDLPWELLVYLGSSERWRYYVEGNHLKWQIGQFLVNRIYPEEQSADSPATNRTSIILNGGSNRDGQSDSDEDDDDDVNADPYISR
ncbi:uncharacterized protein K460DRAFT_327147 [Cucurbitaria berberidis CBS 394.84]|uniref:Uncharacterized protein n=1 Tax=Cucurbitaria berberidis CBS 394.84 TaxID=1168544 RepID=A0A9P4GRU2_9PLEO|nr:uncharacterized protein K460DRAFT_327147 [Cucurbitaria berberidis CBS 394.84]KAF1850364.1 hypothetical protein K460DRAFT_327147 [Cucurbitaria berberidis CBS 394.84]